MPRTWIFSAPALLDRAAVLRSDPPLGAARAVVTGAGCVLMDGNRLARLDPTAVPYPQSRVYLGRDGATDVVAIGVLAADDADGPAPATGLPAGLPAADTLAPGTRWQRLRVALPALATAGPVEVEVAATAVALGAWHERNPRCPRCGAATESASAGWVRRCIDEGSEHYPRTDPAVIVAITDSADRLLLAHVSYHSPLRFSHLAGYVEPGESFEQAAHREVREEAGLEITDLKYVGSQPWPFPASIMVAFTARAVDTTVTVDGEEVVEARWFTRAELAAEAAEGTVVLAPPGSIAREMLEAWYGGPVEDGDRPD